MRVGFFQFAPLFGNVSHNLDTIVATLDQTDADLIVLPELCASGYQFVSQQEVMTLSESVPNGPTTQRLIDLAKRRRMTIVAGLPERAGAACYNSAVVVGPSGFIGCYRKTHLFFEETLFFYARRHRISGLGYRVSQGRRHDMFRLVLSGGGSYVGAEGGRDYLSSLEPHLAKLSGLHAGSVSGKSSVRHYL